MQKIKNLFTRDYDSKTNTYTIPVVTSKEELKRHCIKSPILSLATVIVFIMRLFYKKRK